jgi:hypothetical protein
MKVVLERHADAPVHLRAVLHQLGAVLADVRLGRADQFGGVGVAVRHGGTGGVAAGMARLEPHEHVGEPVLEGLIRRQRPPERVAVERPFDGHVEGRLHGTDRFRVEQHDEALELAMHVLAGVTDRSHHGVGGNPRLVEGHDAEAPGQVDRLHRHSRHTRRGGRDEYLGHAGRLAAGHEEVIGLLRRLHYLRLPA